MDETTKITATPVYAPETREQQAIRLLREAASTDTSSWHNQVREFLAAAPSDKPPLTGYTVFVPVEEVHFNASGRPWVNGDDISAALRAAGAGQ